MQTITIPSFAKINLILRVLDRRADGYHSLENLFQTISLRDELAFRAEPAKTLDVSIDMGGSKIPAGETNLIFKACKAFDREFPLRSRISVEVKKQIPAESGLGGGSSNAAAALIALSRLNNWPVSREKLMLIASSLGADVPFFLSGGSAIGTGKGDLIQPIDDLKPLPVLLVTSLVSCSTPDIYRKFDEFSSLTPEGKSTKIRGDLRPESSRDYVSLIENDLEQVVFAQYPELDSIKKVLIARGAVTAALTGSGSAVFGLFLSAADRDRAVADFQGSICCEFVSRSEYNRALNIVDAF